MKKPAYETEKGIFFNGDSAKLMGVELKEELKGKVNLIITSPPFPLNAKKKYGNLNGQEYLNWFTGLAPIFADLLAPDGSIVVELGNSWEAGRPVQSLLHLESLLGFVKHPKAKLSLCQEFVCYNPSRLPSPAQWVTVNRMRTVDSYTHIWWMSKTDFPKANNSNVLRPYSKSMEKLLQKKKFNAGTRPSQHHISKEGFLKNNGGSIMPNFIQTEVFTDGERLRLPKNVLKFSNTNSNDAFSRRCRERGISPHPARMPGGVVAFFIEFLTDPGDVVLDPFAGSNTTGYIAEKLDRKWVSMEISQEYIDQSKLRFDQDQIYEP